MVSIQEPLLIKIRIYWRVYSIHSFLINIEVWNFITLKLSYLCSTLNFRRRDPFQNWPLHPLAVNMVGWFLIQLKMNLSVVQLFYLLALFWQKSSHALPALYPGSGLLKLVIDTELLHNKHCRSCIDQNSNKNNYCISSYSFRTNYSFLNLEIQRSSTKAKGHST